MIPLTKLNPINITFYQSLNLSYSQLIFQNSSSPKKEILLLSQKERKRGKKNDPTN